MMNQPNHALLRLTGAVKWTMPPLNTVVPFHIQSCNINAANITLYVQNVLIQNPTGDGELISLSLMDEAWDLNIC
jgi:hypothetical protein